MASVEYSVTDEVSQKSPGRGQPDIADLVGIARRGWYVIVAGTVFGLLCALAVLTNLPPVYKASSRIAFERTLPRYLQSNKITNESLIEDADILGQIYVISSESIVLPVVKSLSLASDPEFVGTPRSESLGSRIRQLFRTAAHAMGFEKEAANGKAIERSSDPEKTSVDSVLRSLTVSREDVPSVINVAFSSKDPAKAATIANAIVDTYMDASIAGKVKSTRIAGKVVQERVEELKRQAADAERALLEYKMANNLLGASSSTLTSQQVSTLQSYLTNAQVAMAEAKARMDRITSTTGDSSTSFAPDNELITRLRRQLLDLSARANDIEGRVGKDHLAAIKVRNRMEEVREAIASEQRRISGSFAKDYELARARHDELSATMTASWEAGAGSDVQARSASLRTQQIPFAACTTDGAAAQRDEQG